MLSMFEVNDSVEVIAGKDDEFHDFVGTVIKIKRNTLLVKDADDDVFEVTESQCKGY